MAQYGEANVVIDNIAFSKENLSTGDRPDITVTVRNTNSSSSGSSGYDAFWVYVDSPQLDKHVIAYCGVIQPGGTKQVDESVSKSLGFDGEVPISESQMEVNVKVGGHLPGMDCTAINLKNRSSTDSQTLDITTQVQVGPQTVADISIDSANGGEKSATLTYTVTNTSDRAVRMDVQITPGGRIYDHSLGVGQSDTRTVDLTLDNNQQVSKELCVEMVGGKFI